MQVARIGVRLGGAYPAGIHWGTLTPPCGTPPRLSGPALLQPPSCGTTSCATPLVEPLGGTFAMEPIEDLHDFIATPLVENLISGNPLVEAPSGKHFAANMQMELIQYFILCKASVCPRHQYFQTLLPYHYQQY